MIAAADLFADLSRRPKFRAEYARLAPEFRKVARRIKRAQKSPRAAGRFAIIRGASTLELETSRAGDFHNDVPGEQSMQHAYSGTRARVSATPAVYPDPSAIRRFVRFVADLQRDNSGQPVITTPAEIERATGVSEADQVGIRQFLMLAGRLRLSVVGNAWAYSLEARP